MNQRRPYGRRDELELPQGDRGWLGVNMRLDPSQLPPGYASEAINVRFRNGIAETRLGSMVLPWLNKIVSGNVQPWSAVYGAGVFRDPTNATEYVLLAAEGSIYACLPNNPPFALTLPAGVTVTTTCRFQQAFDVVLLLRGFDDAPLVMTSIVTGFQAIEPSPTGTGTLEIPNVLRSVYAANRVFLATEEDTVVASDILDYTHYTLTDNYRINQGSDDRIVALEMFGPGTIIGLKGRSVYRVDNVYGDLSAASLSRVTSRYGCVAAESVVDCGNDLLWLSQEGVASLTLTQQNEVQAGQGALSGNARMFSEPIQPLIERINWRYASGACGALWNDRYYLALPVDQAEVLGDEVLFYFPIGAQTYPVVSGATYRFVLGEASSLTNGTDTYTVDTEFVAQGSTVTLNGFYTSTSSVKRLWKGVNNVIAVYDFQNQAWSGYDEMAGAAWKQFIKVRVGERERLAAVTHDGYLRIMEEDYTDRRSVVYTDFELSAAPEVGDTLQVNGGTLITVVESVVNTSTTWGRVFGAVVLAAQALYRDSTLTAGFGAPVTFPWTHPNTNATPLFDGAGSASGMRFSATNGAIPAVDFSGTGATITEVVDQEIPVTFVTRGYSSEDGTLSKFSGATFDVQTWNPSLTFELLTDGVNEVESLVESAVTRDRTKYTRSDVEDYDPTNAAGGFYNPYREDYSIQPTSSSYAFTPGADVYGHLHQESREQYGANATGRSARLRLETTQGRVRLMGARVDLTPIGAPAGSST